MTCPGTHRHGKDGGGFFLWWGREIGRRQVSTGDGARESFELYASPSLSPVSSSGRQASEASAWGAVVRMAEAGNGKRQAWLWLPHAGVILRVRALRGSAWCEQRIFLTWL